MATIVDGPEEWSAIIRCAHPTQYPEPRVDGCFSLIKITMADVIVKDDGDGHSWWSIVCPKCNQTLNPKWQIGNGPLNSKLAEMKAKGQK